ncbi:hypothetical protein [Ligilactobacillus salivarius]|nr:hypothetical protein [Ligilactobacillus salivarius]
MRNHGNSLLEIASHTKKSYSTHFSRIKS